jgi:cytochrome P450
MDCRLLLFSVPESDFRKTLGLVREFARRLVVQTSMGQLLSPEQRKDELDRIDAVILRVFEGRATDDDRSEMHALLNGLHDRPFTDQRLVAMIELLLNGLILSRKV